MNTNLISLLEMLSNRQIDCIQTRHENSTYTYESINRLGDANMVVNFRTEKSKVWSIKSRIQFELFGEYPLSTPNELEWNKIKNSFAHLR